MYVAYLSMLPTPPGVGHVTTRHTMPDFMPIVSSGGSVHPASSSLQVPHDTSPSPRHSTEHVSHSLRHLGKDTTPPSNHLAQHRPPLCSDHPIEHGSHSPSSSVPRSTPSISTAGCAGWRVDRVVIALLRLEGQQKTVLIAIGQFQWDSVLDSRIRAAYDRAAYDRKIAKSHGSKASCSRPVSSNDETTDQLRADLERLQTQLLAVIKERDVDRELIREMQQRHGRWE
ncbi:hypothetical protein Sjap_013078 [Stephania japonica]|uniref:Uncharacterized protein n=1 Tax=Stephania japonica TaxID=461633 RepID=A0AAP0P0Z8_9MAGN